MSTDLVLASTAVQPWSESSVPALPWRDLHTVSRTDLAAYIRELERLCLERPASPALWTRLGMAYAVNYDVMKSMEALETAAGIHPSPFSSPLTSQDLPHPFHALN